ncbi:putative gpi-anchor biosynthesis protein (pig-f) [Erysiphe necator]|uniref:Putative gpi-anchor biosynthesis protein (Pig-f) n=1 Tax=Uncinula necator TaxID=52586 RepID=A0A0B1P208_UNCNE|nr:putative gpi-anchor biosynthesis protein (pig-f) [Erysiphe necator]
MSSTTTRKTIELKNMNKSGKPGSQSTTIEILPSTLARIFSLAHPFLLLSVYIARFYHLVSDPVGELKNFLIPLILIQITYVVVCLPIAGFSASSSANLSKVGARGKAKSKKAMKSPSRILVRFYLASNLQNYFFTSIQTILFALCLTGTSIPVLAIIQVLFGAPFTSHLLHTILSSTHLSLLSLFPLIYVHGTDSGKWKQILSAYCPMDEVFGATVGAFIGGWLGAIPIPLDWDREWQKWPITIVTGMYLGYISGKFAGGKVFKGKRIEFD